jgi:hypothetical protein
MRLARTSAIGVAAGAALLLGGSGSAAAAPGNCVSNFTSTLGQAGAAGVVISGGAHMFVPFGANVVRNEAHATLGACPFNPEDYVPPPG